MTASTATSGGARLVALLVAVLTVVLAVVCAVQVFRIGDSGARAAWGDVRYVPQPRTHALEGRQ
jgi:hypothetical protein